jgi:hypothetical protein
LAVVLTLTVVPLIAYVSPAYCFVVGVLLSHVAYLRITVSPALALVVQVGAVIVVVGDDPTTVNALSRIGAVGSHWPDGDDHTSPTAPQVVPVVTENCAVRESVLPVTPHCFLYTAKWCVVSGD